METIKVAGREYDVLEKFDGTGIISVWKGDEPSAVDTAAVVAVLQRARPGVNIVLSRQRWERTTSPSSSAPFWEVTFTKQAVRMFGGRRQNPAPNPAPSTRIQTLIFDRDRFDEASARAWAKNHGFDQLDVDEKTNTLRLRQRRPQSFERGSLKTISLTDGVQAVIGHPAGAAVHANPGDKPERAWSASDAKILLDAAERQLPAGWLEAAGPERLNYGNVAVVLDRWLTRGGERKDLTAEDRKELRQLMLDELVARGALVGTHPSRPSHQFQGPITAECEECGGDGSYTVNGRKYTCRFCDGGGKVAPSARANPAWEVPFDRAGKAQRFLEDVEHGGRTYTISTTMLPPGQFFDPDDKYNQETLIFPQHGSIEVWGTRGPGSHKQAFEHLADAHRRNLEREREEAEATEPEENPRGGRARRVLHHAAGAVHELTRENPERKFRPYCPRCGKLHETADVAVCTDCGAKMLPMPSQQEQEEAFAKTERWGYDGEYKPVRLKWDGGAWRFPSGDECVHRQMLVSIPSPKFEGYATKEEAKEAARDARRDDAYRRRRRENPDARDVEVEEGSPGACVIGDVEVRLVKRSQRASGAPYSGTGPPDDILVEVVHPKWKQTAEILPDGTIEWPDARKLSREVKTAVVNLLVGPPWSKQNTSFDRFEERDELSVRLVDARGRSIVDVSDEDARDLFADGFLSADDLHGSLVNYANKIEAHAAKKR